MMNVIIDYVSARDAIEIVINTLDKGRTYDNFLKVLSWAPPYHVRNTLKVSLSPEEYELLQDYLG